jgi:hypothetical protein
MVPDAAADVAGQSYLFRLADCQIIASGTATRNQTNRSTTIAETTYVPQAALLDGSEQLNPYVATTE